jgi:hypothetical protein
MEGSHKHYVNQYVVNRLALSKTQHQEEKERRQQLARKFALTQTADFEWAGVVNGLYTLLNSIFCEYFLLYLLYFYSF